MKLHGHEIPEEFVREVEGRVMAAGDTTFSKASVEMAFRYIEAGRTLKSKLGIGDLGWGKMCDRLADRLLQRLQKAGKIEYLGRSQGWRVKG